MAFHYTTEGIILKRRDQGEASRIVTVFTKDFGKLFLWATSERKIASKMRAGLQPFSLSQLSFVQGKSKKVLVEAVCLRQYLCPLAELSLLQTALQIVLLVEQHTGEQEKDEKAWELLQETFAKLQQGGELAYESFAPRFMALAGYGGKMFA